MVNCPKCNKILVDSTQDGGFKVRSRMIIVNGSEVMGICPVCKENVTLPITVTLGNIQAPEVRGKLVVVT